MVSLRKSNISCGLGLRSAYYTPILDQTPAIDFFEIISEDYLTLGGQPWYYLDRIREIYPIAMHGVGLCIGNSDPLAWEYLKQLRAVMQRVKPILISDHLCWGSIDGKYSHDLLPLPQSSAIIRHISEKIKTVQDYLGAPILLENVSRYIAFKDSNLTEWEFLTQIAEQAGCYILLDINNIYVNAVNHHFDPLEYLSYIPKHLVKQFHLAGHFHNGNYIVDTHDAPVIQPVWKLYHEAITKFGPIPTVLERDDNFPPFAEILMELDQVKETACIG